MSGGTTALVRGAECRKFAPNIFNKSKCSSCFKQKEEHSAEALECNRATRKISKCGYLFVAPGWDFSNPLNRTKRWQRRWFVLYDDGELTYSVDEHPETVPQARIDMTRVLEVAAAEDVTGHPYSLAITSPEGVTFVKGTCREETRWWADVLQVYSRNKGRHKRNATFPGGQTTILQVTPTIRSNTPNPPRPRFNSCRSEPTRTGSGWLVDSSSAISATISSGFTSNNMNNSMVANSNGNGDVTTNSSRLDNNVNSSSHGFHASTSTHALPNNASIHASTIHPSIHATTNTLSNALNQQPPTINGSSVTANTTVYTILPSISSIATAGYSGGVSTTSSSMCSPLTEKPPMVPSDARSATTSTTSTTTATTTTTTTSSTSSYRDQPASGASPPTRDKLRAEDKARRRMNQQGERRITGNAAGRPSAQEKLAEDDACRRILLEHEREREGKLRDIAASLTQPRARRNKPRISEPTRDVVDAANVAHRDKLIRGDPDGCGLDISGSRYSPTSELRVDLPAEDLLNIKKGWLMKQGANKEWSKHWFVLRGCGLMFYRDPCAEDKGIMDGVIDLNTVTAVAPLQVARNYGFQTVAWDERGSTVFSAVTAGIRSSWMSSIRRAANLPDNQDGSAADGSHAVVCQDNQTESNIQSPTASMTDRDGSSAVPSVSVTPRSVLFSSDEEYRTASEGGRRESGDWSEMPVTPPPLTRNGDWPSMALKLPNWSPSDGGNHEWSELPPSPPLARTALSRVKARSRSSSRSRVYKRSRSSPPSSRRSTLDSVGSEDLVMACCELRGDVERADGRAQSNECLPVAIDDDDDDNDDDDEDEDDDDREAPRKNPLMVDLLENQVSLLRDHLDRNNQSQPSALLVIVERQASEIEGLKSQVKTARAEVSVAEKELARLRQQKTEASIREKRLEETMQRNEQQRGKEMDELEKAKKMYNRDRENLQCKVLETEAILRETTERCEVLTNELATSHRTVQHLQDEVGNLSDRLSRGIEENERLYGRVRELEGKGSLSAARERGRSFDSLSDLTNIDLDLDLHALDKERITEEYEELRSRFEKAILEIRAMRKELREAHAAQDALELEIFAHKQSSANATETNQSQTRLMAARIQDLTSKLAASEKQVRALRQKLTKAETRDKRRSLSLKGREALQVSQEVEEKLLDLENKVRAIEAVRSASAPVSAGNSSKESSPNPRREKKRDGKSLDRARIRRKSLDSATGSEPIKLLIRLNNLEGRVASVTDSINSDAEKDSSECSEISASSGNEVTTEILYRLKKLERVVARSKRRLEKCLGSTQAEDRAEKCLREVNDMLESVQDGKRGSSQISESVGVIVARLEGILREKLTELAERRKSLSENGRLDERAKTRLLAERIAFETVVVGRVKSATSKSGDRSSFIAELVETSQLVTSLKRKVRDTKPKIHANQTPSYARCLVDALAGKLALLGDLGDRREPEVSNVSSSNRMECLQFLARKQKEANDTVRSYKAAKLKELADALALETLEISEQEDLANRQSGSAGRKLLEDRRIREAWTQAQETVSKELVQTEVFHVITRCAQMYEQNVGSINDVSFNLDASPVELESWMDEAQSRLRHEMELSVRELSETYEDSLRSMRAKRMTLDSNKDDRSKSRQMLMDYADVIAHKALIDARIGLARDGPRPTTGNCRIPGEGFVSSLLRNEDLLGCLLDEEDRSNPDEDPIVNAEYVYMFEKFARDCDERINGKRGSKDQLRNVSQALTRLSEDLDGLSFVLKSKTGTTKNLDTVAKHGEQANNNHSVDWPGICEKCADLRERIKRLTELAKILSCGQCAQLQETIHRLTRQHAEELEMLKKNQERDLIDIRSELDDQRHSLTSQYEQEAASLRERARKLEQRLNAMDSEHSAHVNELRAAYQRSISAELDTDAETRKRYKEEIKQLRALCEKGLLAMENSHRRIIGEMEEKHRQELESLRVEKEQALSEETQATLAALDAMRKAHEHEVQKEIAKFKQEFIKQVQAREDIGALHKEHEEEMEEIKREILSLSAKYSSKCVESAALEEKVGTLSKQLTQAQQHIMQLDARNKQLRAHLMMEANDVGDAMEILRGRETEIAEQREEIHRLQQQLKHGDSPREKAVKSGKAGDEAGNVTAEETKSTKSTISNTSRRGCNEKIRQASLSTQRKSQSADRPSGGFSYKLERLKSISLPYASPIITEKTPDGHERNGRLTLWDSLRPRTGLPHQYQGGTAEMRLGGVGAARTQEAEQNQEQQRQQRADDSLSSRLTPEPPTLSVAELMRSPAVRWSSRSCRSLPPTPSPSYHHPLHLPLPAVGMVAERKKRFEL